MKKITFWFLAFWGIFPLFAQNIIPVGYVNEQGDCYTGLMNSDGILIKSYEDCMILPDQIKNGYAIVMKDYTGVINYKGETVLPFEFNNIEPLSEGLFYTEQYLGNVYFAAYYDTNGIRKIDLDKNFYGSSFSEGVAYVYNTENKLYGIIDKTGKYLLKPQYRYQIKTKCKEGLLGAMDIASGKYGFIDKYGNVKIPFVFEDVREFNNGLASVKQNNLWGAIDKNGNWVIEPFTPFSFSFNDNWAIIFENDRLYYIDKTGKPIWKDKHISAMTDFVDNRAFICIDSKTYLVDKNFKIYLTIPYEMYIGSFLGDIGLLSVQKYNNDAAYTYYINIKTGEIIYEGYLCVGLACPFVYLNKNEKFFEIGEILKNQNFSTYNRFDSVYLGKYSADDTLKIRIYEKKLETTYLDNIYLKVGNLKILPTEVLDELKEVDKKMVVLKTKDYIDLQFLIPKSVKDKTDVYLFAKGFYLKGGN